MTTDLATSSLRARAGSTRAFWIAVVLITLAGLAWRLAYTWAVKGDAFLGGDGFYYHHQALVLRDGQGFIDPIRYISQSIETPTAGHPPLYPIYLAGWTFLGVDTPLGHRLASCLLGAATIVVVALVARRLGGPTAGVIAAALAAAYPMLWINDAMLLSEPMAALTVAISLLAAYRYWDDPSFPNAAVLGVAYSLAVLSRAEAVLLFPLVVLVLVLRARLPDWRARVRALLVVSFAAVIVLGPWVGRNLVVFEHPVLLSNGFGATLRGATCDDAWYGSGSGLFAFCPSDTGTGDESERDREAREQAFDYIGEHGDRLPSLAGIRVLRAWELYAPMQNTNHYAHIEDRGRNASFAGLWSFYLLGVLALAGGTILWQRKLPVMPFLALALTATFTAAITYANVRYRIAIEVGVVTLAGLALATVWDRAMMRS